MHRYNKRKKFSYLVKNPFHVAVISSKVCFRRLKRSHRTWLIMAFRMYSEKFITNSSSIHCSIILTISLGIQSCLRIEVLVSLTIFIQLPLNLAFHPGGIYNEFFYRLAAGSDGFSTTREIYTQGKLSSRDEWHFHRQ